MIRHHRSLDGDEDLVRAFSGASARRPDESASNTAAAGGMGKVGEGRLMDKENRNAPRRSVRHTALIIGPDKSLIQTCAISDISETGAQLKLASTDEIPDQITLVLAKGGKVQRQCTVVWRAKNRIGVEFLPPKAATAG